MNRPKAEWDPTWDDDWQAAQPDLEDQIREDRPPEPEKAVEYYRYGFSAAKRQPAHEWPQIEGQLYEDYMGNVGEPVEEEGWPEVTEWAHRGWHSGSAQLELGERP